LLNVGHFTHPKFCKSVAFFTQLRRVHIRMFLWEGRYQKKPRTIRSGAKVQGSPPDTQQKENQEATAGILFPMMTKLRRSL
jgi:hypothetical protein